MDFLKLRFQEIYKISVFTFYIIYNKQYKYTFIFIFIMVKIVFWDNCLCERGTTVSLFNYAYYNKTLLGNESVIMYNTTRIENDAEVIAKFQKNFQVIGVPDFSMVDNILSNINCDIFYITKAGGYEGQVSRVCKTVVHCVFNYSQPHGNVYAGISNWINGGNGINGDRVFPVVPYMVDLPADTDKNMRKELNIPEDAVVYGRHGGYGQFDIPYVHNIVYNVAKEYPNIYFLFLNTQKFCPDLPNIIHLGRIIDIEKKIEFINTCDAMLWARTGGESFGLSIGEFSIKNKPIFVTHSGEGFGVNKGDIAHVYLLGDKGLWYNETNLKDMLINFDKKEMAKKDWNAYKDYTPEKVMQIFKKEFIDN